MPNQRRKFLGEVGELLALKSLVDHGYTNIKNLNDLNPNQKFADLYAEKDEKRYLISVKARNKYKKVVDGKPIKVNSSYNLLYNYSEFELEELSTSYNAELHWIAVQIDRKTYSLFMGAVSEITQMKRKGIPFFSNGDCKCGECLVEDKKHYFDHNYLKN